MAKNKHILIGQLGESIVCGFLKNRNFSIIQRNYRKKCGEIDIIAQKDSVLHFVEVKSCEIYGKLPEEGVEAYRPEDHIDYYKKLRLKRVIELYLLEKNISKNKEWTIDVAVVYINRKKDKAHIKIIDNVIL